MDVELVLAPSDAAGRLTGEATRDVLARLGDRACAVVAAAGSTNLGLVDDLDGVGRASQEAVVWFHVDAAYGGAALAAPSVRNQFTGIERCDSFVVDPHKWLFAPFDCCALSYREPNLGRAAPTQHAGYLEVLTSRDEWNPSDYAAHLTRRARGLPFWFSLACHGVGAYRRAVETTLATARRAAELIELSPHTELVSEPSLSVVVFRRLGWNRADYYRWSETALADRMAFVVPTIHDAETVLRFCFVNPRTTADDVALILSSMA